MSLQWYPKVYSEGDIDGAGLRKLLGASHHDPLALLVRETIQNSWDASRGRDGSQLFPGLTPSWTFELRTLTQEERSDLHDAFEAKRVPGLPLKEHLRASKLRVIEISDRNTSGLGGPIRPDIKIPDGVPTDFIDLVFNVGAPQDTQGGGGTYGFGKIAAFGVSQCATVLYRTTPVIGTTAKGRADHRLIGSSIGDHFEFGGKRHTGRHWWGQIVDERPRPLTGRAAQALAERLFRHDFGSAETGTSILIVQPDLGGRDESGAMKHVLESVLWNAWPKLVPFRDGDEPPMHLRVLHDGVDVPIPDPLSIHPFSGFVDALRNVRARADGKRSTPPPIGPWTLHVQEETFESSKPVKTVGHVAVAFAHGGSFPEGSGGDDGVVSARHFDGPAHHLALLREPELVVRYLPGPPPKQQGAQYCGVFKPVRDLDSAFAEAEPPSHDDWLVGRVSGRNEKIFVRRGREHGPTELFAGLGPKSAEAPAATAGHRLAAIADALGHLLSTGERLSPVRRGPGRPPKPKPKILDVRGSTLVMLPEGVPGIRVDFSLRENRTVRVTATVALAGGGSDASEDLADRRPDVLGITSDPESPAGASGGEHVALDAGDWHVWVRNAGGVAAAVDIQLAEEA
jgi:hypothetical protein